MKKILFIGLSVSSLAVVSSAIVLPVVVKIVEKNKSFSQPDLTPNPSSKILKFRSNLLASNFNLANKKPSEAEGLITKSWLVENKDKLFDENNYLNSENDIEKINFTKDEYDLTIEIDGFKGIISDFFPEKSDIFESILSFPLKSNETVNTYEYEDYSIMNSIGSYLYLRQKNILGNSPAADTLQKAQISGYFMEWDFDLSNWVTSVNENNKQILGRTFWGKSFYDVSLNNKYIKNAKRIKVVYKVVKESGSYLVFPFKYEIELLSGIKELLFPENYQSKNAYSLKFRTRSDKPIGDLLEWPTVIPTIPVQVNRALEAKEFGINENSSLLSIAQQVGNVDFVWNNKNTLFTNVNDFEHKDLIEKVEYDPQYDKSLVKVTVHWLQRKETTEFKIFVNVDEQIKAMGLDRIRQWNSVSPKEILGSKLEIEDFRATIMRDIFFEQRDFFNSNLQFQEIFQPIATNDEFFVQLKSSQGFSAWALTFRSWWNWKNYSSWADEQRKLGTLPMVDNIDNLKLFFKIKKEEVNINGRKGYRVSVVPKFVSISYKDSAYPTIELYFQNIQNSLSSYREFIVVG